MGTRAPFFSIFGSNLLESKADGIEVSYNACGVLSHIMFDGPEAWGICEPRREEVEERMWAAIQSWDINSRRNINYRCRGARVWCGSGVGAGQGAPSQQGLVGAASLSLGPHQVSHIVYSPHEHRAGRYTSHLYSLVHVSRMYPKPAVYKHLIHVYLWKRKTKKRHIIGNNRNHSSSHPPRASPC